MPSILQERLSAATRTCIAAINRSCKEELFAVKIKPKARLIIFLKMISRHWKAMTLGGILSLLAAVSAIGLLSLSGWFLAATAYAGLNVATAKAFNFFFPSIGVRIFAITRTLTRYGERVISHDATFKILETLRTWCYTRLEPLAPARLGRIHSGDLLTRIITDIDTLDNLYLRVLSPTAVAATVTALLTGFIYLYNPNIALLCAGSLVTAGIGIPFIADRAARSAARMLNEQTARLRTVLVDGINGLAALLACGAQTRQLEQIRLRHQEMIRTQYKMSRVTGLTNALMTLVSGIAVVGSLYIGVGAVTAGNLTGPQLALIVLAVIAGFDALIPLPKAYQYLGQTKKAADRLLKITQMQPAVTFKKKSNFLPRENHISFENISFQYTHTHHPALEKVSIEIQPRQHTAIMGATGSGKSTLLYLLARFEDPSRGEIKLGDVPLNHLAEKELRNRVCIVDQRAHIFNGTLQDNLLIANPRAKNTSIHDALSCVLLSDLVQSLPKGIDTWVGEAGRLLSGGQARRLSIARALLSDAPIWAFDEPTEGLDTETAGAMMQNLMKQGTDKTIIMITHRPEALERMDQIIVLDSGRIAAAGPHEKLKTESELYRRLTGHDNRRGTGPIKGEKDAN